MSNLATILRHYPRVYAIEVGATRSRSTLYYRLFVVQADRTPLDITAMACEVTHAPFMNVYNAITWPGHYGALHSLIGTLQRRTVGDNGVLSIKLL